MTCAGMARPLLAVSAALSAGWLLVACGDDGTADTETPTVETTETTELTETTEPTETTAPSDGENTIEIPSPDVDIPSPELPEVTPSPVP
ncbi:hypothetical protein [Mycolicibacterium pyrenivorans]|uniref:hypothetical protein n=1 Tax=Mycolicibacterium pyrenivorans TaxID=187102 RepID=UPI0021F2BA4E|nr:hypothetical protein [Mycolicibacterium pyrenivorans]MCV7154249.1 hypothetical protein [Mycolicibacterium pyrenivorans]